MPKKIKPRNAGTMTESAFRGMIRSALRKLSIYRKPISITKQKSRREYKGENKRQRREYQCNICKKRFPDKIGKKTAIQIDHIIPAGTLTCSKDLPGFVDRMFVEDGFQVLCKNCHKAKTDLEKK